LTAHRPTFRSRLLSMFYNMGTSSRYGDIEQAIPFMLGFPSEAIANCATDYGSSRDGKVAKFKLTQHQSASSLLVPAACT